MARIKSTKMTSEYSLSIEQTALHGERNDCAVRAVSIATQTEYKAVLGLMAEKGRRPGRGTYMATILETVNDLGFRTKWVASSFFINQYPGRHAELKSVTTHHPARFRSVWEDGNTYLISTTRHIAAVVNGAVHDWTAGRALRAISIYKIVKPEA